MEKPRCGMVVGEGVVDGHVVEEGQQMRVEEALDFSVVEAAIDEDGAEVGLDYIRKTLYEVRQYAKMMQRTSNGHTFGGGFTVVQ